MTTPRTPQRWPDRDPTIMSVYRPIAEACTLLEPPASTLYPSVADVSRRFIGRPDMVPTTSELRDRLAPLIIELSRGEEGGRYRRAADLLIEAGRAAGALDRWHQSRAK